MLGVAVGVLAAFLLSWLAEAGISGMKRGEFIISVISVLKKIPLVTRIFLLLDLATPHRLCGWRGGLHGLAGGRFVPSRQLTVHPALLDQRFE